MDSARAIIVAAISSRALAVSARRGGYLPLAIDFFGDQDTCAVAAAHVRLTGMLAHGIDETALLDAVAKLSARHRPLGIVCGSGFEDRPQLLARLAERLRLFGNSAEAVTRIKNPALLESLCGELSIPFPRISLTRPAQPAGWLAKRHGGAGGSHVKPARDNGRAGAKVYYQREAAGAPVSVLFLADGGRAHVLGLSEQWALPRVRQRYRYGGAIRPADVSPRTAEALKSAVHRLVAAIPLVGLNSADFLVGGEDFWLLEINPRPGATLDIFEPPTGSLFALHVAACDGSLPPISGDADNGSDRAKAAAIVYAEDPIPSVPDLRWPEWSADRPLAGSAIKAGEPLCTVYACGAAAAQVRASVEERRKMILAWTRGRKL